MAATTRFEIKIEGLDALLRKLRGQALYAQPYREALAKSALLVESAGKKRAPVDTGRLRASITHRLDPRDAPLWAEVGTNVRHKGESYPAKLELSDRTHYRRGPFKGQPTKGWLSGALQDSRAQIERFLAVAAAKIEAAWGQR